MLFGIGIGPVVALIRETRRLEGSTAPIAIAGPGARELAGALAAGGDPAAVQVDGDPYRAPVAVRVVDGEPSVAELEIIRRLSRDGTPLVVVQLGRGGRIPNVLPEDVVSEGPDPPVEAVAAAIVRAASGGASPLAARLPLLRPIVERRLVRTTALTNAAIAGSPRTRGAQLPALTLAQSRMLLLLGLGRGNVLPRDPQGLAVAAAPALVGSLGLGLGARALARRPPFKGPLGRAAVAYAATWALGAAGRRL